MKILRDGREIFLEGTSEHPSEIVNDFLVRIHDCLKSGYNDIILNFEDVKGEFSTFMLPIIAICDWLRANDGKIDIRLPRKSEIKKLFFNAGWAHLLVPNRYNPNEIKVSHFNARRFTTANEQHISIRDMLQILIASDHGKISDDILRALEWSLSEITDNVLVHAESSLGGLVQMAILPEEIIFTVCDIGRGILPAAR